MQLDVLRVQRLFEAIPLLHPGIEPQGIARVGIPVRLHSLLCLGKGLLASVHRLAQLRLPGKGGGQILLHGSLALADLVQRRAQGRGFGTLAGGLLLERRLAGAQGEGLPLGLIRRGQEPGGLVLGLLELIFRLGEGGGQLGNARLLLGNLTGDAAAAALLIFKLPAHPFNILLGILRPGLQDGAFTLLLVEHCLLPGNGVALLLQLQVCLVELERQLIRELIKAVEGGVLLLQGSRCCRIVPLGLLGGRGQSLEILEPQGNFQPLERLPKGEVLLRLLRLHPEGLHLEFQFGDLIADSGEVVLGGCQAPLGLLLAVAVLGNARRLLEDLPAVGALHGQNLIDPALADVGVALLAKTRIHEHLIDIPKAGRLAIDIVFTLPRAVIPPGDHHLGRVHRKRAIGIIENQRGFGKAQLASLLCAAEDHVLHLCAPEGFGAHLPHDPADGVGNIGFSAAVGADNRGDVAVKVQNRLVRKGFEALNFQRFEVHVSTSPISCYRYILAISPCNCKRVREKIRLSGKNLPPRPSFAKNMPTSLLCFLHFYCIIPWTKIGEGGFFHVVSLRPGHDPWSSGQANPDL